MKNQNKKRLISLMLAGTFATAGLTACSSDVFLDAGSTAREHFNIETSLDAGTQITNVLSYNLILDGQKCYLKLFGHYDEGCLSSGGRISSYTYTNHKDYMVTYEISQDEYRQIAKFYDNSKNYIKHLNIDNLAVLQDIVDTHDPISVEDNIIDNKGMDIHRQ